MNPLPRPLLKCSPPLIFTNEHSPHTASYVKGSENRIGKPFKNNVKEARSNVIGFTNICVNMYQWWTCSYRLSGSFLVTNVQNCDFTPCAYRASYDASNMSCDSYMFGYNNQKPQVGGISR